MKQIDFILQKSDLSRLNCELAVKIHAWLMTHINADDSKKLHTSDEIRPFSLFIRVQEQNIVLRLSLLNDEVMPLLEATRKARAFEISGLEKSLPIIGRIEKPAIALNQLRRPAPKEFAVILASPASYRHNGKESNLYALEPLLQTVAAKLRAFEGVDIPNEEVAELCDQVTYARYKLRTSEYKIKPGIVRPSFEGELYLRPEGTPVQREKMALLLRYAAYAGVGAKTALGMGGIILFDANLNFKDR
ncbi:MAG: CRISPR system precrRNA processing endoribonuclease RAMP protein Cas6 [Clostridiales bacterium]|jgi:hypothetical protein|nr:CRISPR system precrRNA processing endoribonuclease RAMP protein Cas6 [Clostridiales bacterium]